MDSGASGSHLCVAELLLCPTGAALTYTHLHKWTRTHTWLGVSGGERSVSLSRNNPSSPTSNLEMNQCLHVRFLDVLNAAEL